MNIGVLASHDGTTLQSLLDVCRATRSISDFAGRNPNRGGYRGPACLRLLNVPLFEREIGCCTIDFDNKRVGLVKHGAVFDGRGS